MNLDIYVETLIILSSVKARKELKVKFYKMLVRPIPVMLYGIGTLVMSQRDTSWIQASEINVVIAIARSSRLDKMSSGKSNIN